MFHLQPLPYKAAFRPLTHISLLYTFSQLRECSQDIVTIVLYTSHRQFEIQLDKSSSMKLSIVLWWMFCISMYQDLINIVSQKVALSRSYNPTGQSRAVELTDSMRGPVCINKTPWTVMEWETSSLRLHAGIFTQPPNPLHSVSRDVKSGSSRRFDILIFGSFLSML